MRKSGLNNKRLGWRLILLAALVLALVSGAIVPQIDTASAQESNPIRNLPNPDPTTVERGVTLDVMVTFAAPGDDFNAITLTDNVPTGWTIQVDTSWCTPAADYSNIVGNQSQYMWYDPYNSEESFTALYKVTVPADAEFDTYLFHGQLGYKIAISARVFKDIGGDSSINVTVADPSSVPTPTPAPSPTLTPTPTSSLTPTPTPAPSTTPTPIPVTEGSLGPGAWIGIGIVSLLGILLLVGLAMWMVKRQRIKEA